jgi:hypothetical protein
VKATVGRKVTEATLPGSSGKLKEPSVELPGVVDRSASKSFANQTVKLAIDQATAIVKLEPFRTVGSADFTANIAGASVRFRIEIRRPIEASSGRRELFRYEVSPWLVVPKLEYADEIPQKRPPKPAKPAPAAAPPIRAPPGVFLIPILSQDDRQQFWSASALEYWVSSQTKSLAQYEGAGMPTDELKAQLKYFEGRMQKLTQDGESGALTPEVYKADVEAAVAREKAKLEKRPPHEWVFMGFIIQKLEWDAADDDDDDE